VIAVIGNPVGRRDDGVVVAAGVPVAVARAAVAAGGSVQVIGKVGEGAEGDAILLSLAADGVGHVAVLRDPAPAPVVAEDAETDPSRHIDELAGLDTPTGEAEPVAGVAAALPTGPALEAADLDLALRYLPDYRVVVLAQPLGEEALAAAVDAIRWSGAQLVLVAAGESRSSPNLPEGATVLEAPAEDAEGAFAAVVGRYAAALDGGTPPADAFAMASGAAGWTAVAD
jgi:hypothetical protein